MQIDERDQIMNGRQCDDDDAGRKTPQLYVLSLQRKNLVKINVAAAFVALTVSSFVRIIRK